MVLGVYKALVPGGLIGRQINTHYFRRLFSLRSLDSAVAIPPHSSCSSRGVSQYAISMSSRGRDQQPGRPPTTVQALIPQGPGQHLINLKVFEIQHPSHPPRISCAILIACASVYDPVAYFEQGEIRVLEAARDGRPIKVPTVHIWGERDALREESKGMSELCEPELATVFVHESGHEVPRLSTKSALAGSVRAVRRGITTAALLEQA